MLFYGMTIQQWAILFARTEAFTTLNRAVELKQEYIKEYGTEPTPVIYGPDPGADYHSVQKMIKMINEEF